MGHISTSKKIILSVLGILLILSLLVGVSYAYYMVSVSQTNKNVVKSSCLNLSISNEENVIRLEKQIPIMNEEGKKLTPYTFTVNNTCNSMMAYSLNLEELEGSTLASKYIMTMVNDRDYINMASLGSTDNYYANSVESRVLATGSLGPNASIDYSLRLWMDEATPLTSEAMNKSFRSKVVVVATPTKSVDFDYTGTEQVFTVPADGKYKIELWGASGGGVTVNNTFYNGGLGGYVSGTIDLANQQKLYIYVGGSTSTYEGGYNGGAKGGTGDDEKYTGGGGATDIRINNGNWNDFDSLKSRIMVAAGGAGTGYYSSESILGGSGGGLNGSVGNIKSCDDSLDMNHIIATAGTQNKGGLGCQNCRKASGNTGNGYFGYSTIIGYGYGTGGGSGYYGGGTGGDTSCNVSSGAGGSSFISGHNGCNAIKEESTKDNIIHTGQSIHYSGLYFADTVMIDGEGYKWTTEKGSYTGMPTHDGTGTMKGNTGNGYAKITYIG